MSFELYLVVLLLTLGVLYLVVPSAARAYLRFRGKRVITCPETRKHASVEVDATHAALTAAFSYPDLHLKACSRWLATKNMNTSRRSWNIRGQCSDVRSKHLQEVAS
jgi:hypothetical protein